MCARLVTEDPRAFNKRSQGAQESDLQSGRKEYPAREALQDQERGSGNAKAVAVRIFVTG